MRDTGTEMPRALLSVSDKTGVEPLARALHARGWTLLSTGGTARALRAAGLEVRDVSDVTDHPEIMDGRVKTLHPAVHAGLLARAAHEADARQIQALGYEPIDMVVVNLYPFRETIAVPDARFEDAVENIDIGGPAMIRAAAKNHERVWVVVEPAAYDAVLAALDEAADAQLALRRGLAARAFDHVAAYDASIARYLGTETESSPEESARELPQNVTITLEKVQDLRYGENPEQAAAFYRQPGHGGFGGLRQLQGKELSFNNLLDMDAAVLAVSAWPPAEPACVVIKHTTPCGIAIGESAEGAFRRALATDPTSAFGSVIGLNVPVDEATAEALRGLFVEVVIAPGFDEAALSLLAQKKNLRLVQLDIDGTARSAAAEWDVKRVPGGALLQQRLRSGDDEQHWRVVTARRPTDAEWRDLRFAWRAVAPVKSNAILVARDGMALGIGAGQTSRVESSRIAVAKARENGHGIMGSALASDAFFPFRDGVDAAAEAGVRCIVQPGGSIRDAEVVAAADEHGIAMVFTGRRLFRH
jgi:phosphoribosylaminoimidazolecarboxamide formyltransferase / IMP cyclohydrolase